MYIFSEMVWNFFYKKLVTGWRNIGMEYAWNAEGAADNACAEKNYSYHNGFRWKRGNDPEAKVYGQSGKNRSCKTEKIGYFKFKKNDKEAYTNYMKELIMKK